jgi:hypothetical protein
MITDENGKKVLRIWKEIEKLSNDTLVEVWYDDNTTAKVLKSTLSYDEKDDFYKVSIFTLENLMNRGGVFVLGPITISYDDVSWVVMSHNQKLYLGASRDDAFRAAIKKLDEIHW